MKTFVILFFIILLLIILFSDLIPVELFELLNGNSNLFLLIIILLFLITIGAVSNQKSKVDNDKQIHAEKSVIYKTFIDLWTNIDHNQIEKEGGNLKKAMILWANDHVLKNYLVLQSYYANHETDQGKINKQVEKVILEMRRDLGEKNTGIMRGDILILINRTKVTHYEKQTTKKETAGNNRG